MIEMPIIFNIICSLARAMYRQADVYLLDDCLSAVDTHVGSHLFNECIGPQSQLARHNATRILVTHQVHFLKEADWVVIMKDVSSNIECHKLQDILTDGMIFQGRIENQGSPTDLTRGGVDVLSLLRAEEVDETVNVLNSTQSVHSVPPTSLSYSDDMRIIRLPEKNMQKMLPKGNLLVKYFRSGGNTIELSLVGILFILSQFLASFADYWVSFWTSQEELRTNYAMRNESAIDALQCNANTAISTNKDDALMYSEAPSIFSTKQCIYIHGALMLALFIVTSARSISFYRICLNASKTLHNTMFNRLILSSMRFFDTNPSGRILNHFTKEMGAVDEFLPKAVLDASQYILNMMGVVIVTVIVNPLFLIPIVGMSVAFIFIRRVYLKTSKEMKRLEGICMESAFFF